MFGLDSRKEETGISTGLTEAVLPCRSGTKVNPTVREIAGFFTEERQYPTNGMTALDQAVIAKAVTFAKWLP